VVLLALVVGALTHIKDNEFPTTTSGPVGDAVCGKKG